MAPGDREWVVEAERRAKGVPVDPDSVAAFKAFGKGFQITLPSEPG